MARWRAIIEKLGELRKFHNLHPFPRLQRNLHTLRLASLAEVQRANKTDGNDFIEGRGEAVVAPQRVGRTSLALVREGALANWIIQMKCELRVNIEPLKDQLDTLPGKVKLVTMKT